MDDYSVQGQLINDNNYNNIVYNNTCTCNFHAIINTVILAGSRRRSAQNLLIPSASILSSSAESEYWTI